jgi:hypothetical protein
VRLYDLYRDEDPSGVSGTGHVAEVCEFSTGWCVVSFLPHTAGIPNVIVYGNLTHVVAIHGHEGKTRLVARGER